MTRALLEVRNLKKHFRSRDRAGDDVRAVDGISFDIAEGKTFGLVGESGCGKSTAARTIVRLLEPTEGSIRFMGSEIARLSRSQLRPLRQEMQMVFQDPFTALDPRMTVHDIIAEPLHVAGTYQADGGQRRIEALMETVGLDAGLASRKPVAFSGGQRQRIGIARALATRPRLIVLDEPVSALDVSIQAQVVNLLQDLQSEYGIAYLIIAHDLAVIRHISDEVGVMYLGRIVERGSRQNIYSNPCHPYSMALLSAVPDPGRFKDQSATHIVLHGEIPSPSNPPSGCSFSTRCWMTEELCITHEPQLEIVEASHHLAACHFSGRLFAAGETEGSP